MDRPALGRRHGAITSRSGEPGCRRWLAAAIAVVAAAVTFAILHSGSRAGAVCEREVFVGSGRFSLWPPGARCSFGEPARETVVVDPLFAVIAALVAVVGLVVLWNRPARD